MPTPSPQFTSALADRYRIDREIGAGGMATVYLAHDIRHDRQVAVKILRPELAAIIGGERFLHEIRTTANLQHPHILPLHDSGEAGGSVFYVMPFVEGQSLRDRLSHEKQLPVDEAVRITREVASALDYAHRHGVVHRDIKPENILLHDGQALVADFGIALAVSRSDGGTRMTETGMSLGTPHYMAPEQAMGEREISPRADVYALGCVLYECLVGEPPFTGPTAQAIIARVMTDSPRALQTQRHTIPPHVESAVRTALEKLPADRFASAAAFAEALGNATYGLSATTTEAADAAGRGAWHPRAWSVATKAFAGATVALAGVSAYLIARSPAERAPMPVIAAQIADSVNAATLPAISSLGAVAWVSESGVQMRMPGATAPVLLNGTQDVWSGAIAFSPDGSEFLFAIRSGQGNGPNSRFSVMRMPTAGGVPISVNTDATARAGANLDALVWHADGNVYASSSDVPAAQSAVLRFPATGGTADTVAVLPQTFAVANAILPNGRVLLMSLGGAGGANARVVALDIASGDTTTVIGGARTAAWSPTGHVIVVRTDGSLVAVPADGRTGKPTGAQIPLSDSVAVNGSGAGFSLSSTGSLVYVRGVAVSSGLGMVRVTLLGVDGSAEAVPLPPTDHPDAALSPNGRYVLYTRNDHIWMYDIDVGTHRQITSARTLRHHNPVWAPDGKLIAFRADTISGTTGGIVVTSPDSAPGTILRYLTETRPMNPSQWLADGSIVYHSEQPQVDVMKISADGSSPAAPVLNADWGERAGRVSPDGRWIAYVSNEDGQQRVYARRWPDLTLKSRIADATLPASFPIWSADGRSLYISSNAGLSRIDVEARATGLTPVRQVKISASVSGTLHTLHPDGRRMLHLSRLAADQTTVPVTPRLIVIANWRDGLRQRLGAVEP